MCLPVGPWEGSWWFTGQAVSWARLAPGCSWEGLEPSHRATSESPADGGQKASMQRHRPLNLPSGCWVWTAPGLQLRGAYTASWGHFSGGLPWRHPWAWLSPGPWVARLLLDQGFEWWSQVTELLQDPTSEQDPKSVSELTSGAEMGWTGPVSLWAPGS